VANFEMLHSQAHNDLAFLYAFDLLEGAGRRRPSTISFGGAQGPPAISTEEGVSAWASSSTSTSSATERGAVFEHACKLGFEGIVSKHREHPYRSGPSKVWIKVKNPTAPGVLRFQEEEA
jgi:bifunctional non-homologous end joining protein LigD